MIGDFGPFQITIASAIYAFLGYCLYLIAKKTGQEKPWWGWVPILQVLLMLKVAGVPWWWIFLFFIPLVNIGVAIIVWIKIAKKLNKSAWWGALMVVPGIDLLVLGYLAFSK